MTLLGSRDLKPENLLLKSHPAGLIVKIVDFGLSNTHENNRLLQTACGSPCYAAPEMIEGKMYVGPKADIWSLGVILFAMVCGFLPFEDNNTSILYKKILAGQYKTPNYISAVRLACLEGDTKQNTHAPRLHTQT
jgi:5'-AMP-activated protein kinase catalytic alpha subunit